MFIVVLLNLALCTNEMNEEISCTIGDKMWLISAVLIECKDKWIQLMDFKPLDTNVRR